MKKILAALFLAVFFLNTACSSSDDYVSEQEIRLMIREELRNYLTQDQIKQLISSSSVSEDRIKQIISEELKNSLTPEQIRQIIDAVNPGLTEEQIRQIIKEEVDKIATNWEVIAFSVKKEDWAWNENAEQYEVVFDFEELTEFIYENGITLGYIFLGEQGNDEVQKLLPYVFTYKELINGETIVYTETVSYDVQLGTGGKKSTVAFFIQASDRARADQNLTNYNFRVVLIW